MVSLTTGIGSLIAGYIRWFNHQRTKYDKFDHLYR